MRRLSLAVAAILGACAAQADSPPMPGDAEARWKAEIEDANAAYATKPTAILKIDDAIYLKPGERAWLVQGPGHMAWTMKAPPQPSPVVMFSGDGKTGVYTGRDGGIDLLADGNSPHELSPALRVSGGLAQITPDDTGLRIAVYSDANPAAASFSGLEYFPYDPAFVVQAEFKAAPAWTRKTFQTSRGWYKAFYHIGDAVFMLKGKPIRLPMYAGSDKLEEIDSLSAFIMDDTTGKETYGVGRYIDVNFPKGGIPEQIALDFNYLYNPNCARSPHYNCPVAVDRIALAVTAGEMKPSGAHVAQP
jgi:uncharacterized protein (DUF1684 family)